MSKLVRYDPFAELNALQRRFFGDDMFMPDAATNIPATDVYEKNGDLVVEAHLPNFEQKDVDIQIDGNNLVISAERHEREEDKGKKYIIRESASNFYRTISLPERADKDKISADMVDGKLVVTVPMTPLPEVRRVQIGTGESGKKAD